MLRFGEWIRILKGEKENTMLLFFNGAQQTNHRIMKPFVSTPFPWPMNIQLVGHLILLHNQLALSVWISTFPKKVQNISANHPVGHQIYAT